jgi:hypothetical protein
MNSTFDLNRDQLARLLAMGRIDDSSAGRSLAESTPGDLLRDMMSSPLSLDPNVPDSVPFVLGHACDELAPHAGRPIGDLLAASDLDVGALRALKDYGKILVRRSRTDAERAAATALYYAAIANALVHHGQTITEHAPAALSEALGNLTARDWLPDELKNLMMRSLDACSERDS